MESDWCRYLSVESEGKFLLKFPMQEDVETVLAQVAAILQDTADYEGKEDTGNWCKSPFCGKALLNIYASYCEEQSCQQYRAMKLQCLANANAAAVAVADIEANGRRDSFLVLGATETADDEKECAEAEKEHAEVEESFVIPRRKRLRTDASMQNGDQQPSNPKLPRIRPRMGFNEILAHFEPRTVQVPALAVSSQMKARREQQASRWTQSRRQFKVVPMVRPRTPVCTGGNYYGRPRYDTWYRSIQSGPRTPNRPRLALYRRSIRPPRSETAHSGVERRREFPPRPQGVERSYRGRYFAMGANSHSVVREPPEGSSQPYEHFPPRQSQWLSSDPPPMDRRNEVTGNPDVDWRFVRRPQYDEHDEERNQVLVGVEQEGTLLSRDSGSCRDERDRYHVELATEPIPARLPPEAPKDQFVFSDTDMDCEASFSVHDSFLPHLLSTFIRHLPNQLKAVMNSTKRSRKMKWYLEYTQRIERICSPHVYIQMESKAVVVLVKNRVWLQLKGPSTVILLEKTIQTMRDHAISWREIKFEVKQSLDLYRSRRGDAVDMGSVFMRAWNNAKGSPHGKLLPRGVNYFCGSRLHHWSFVLGKVEIGSGSHDDKREAFRLAAANAAEFILGLSDGKNDHTWRPPRPHRATPTEDDSDCELLYVKDPTDEAAAAATASAIELSSSSKSSSADVSDTEVKTERGGNSASTVIVISDSEDEDIPELNGSASISSSAPQPVVDVAASETAVAPTSQCSMCEVIWMRKPDSAGCRRCQLASKQTKSSLETSPSKSEVAASSASQDSGVEPDSSNSPRSGQLSRNSDDSCRNTQTEAASRPTKRLRSFFESIRMTE